MEQWLLAALSAVAGFLAKSIWDLYWKRREQIETLAREKRVDFLERQLSQFYWPLYLQLQKNNVIWEHLMRDKAIEDSIKQQVDAQLYKTFFQPNHDMMVKIIESNVHLAQPDREFDGLLLRFVRHITIYKAIKDAGLMYDPIAVGEPWPEEFFPAVERRLRSVQQEFDRELGKTVA